MNRRDTRDAAAHTGAQAWRARALGQSAADLEIDLRGADRAGAVTALLAACISDADGAAPGMDTVWDWTLNRRLQGLIAMRLAAGQAQLALQSHCAACGEPMEIELDLHAFAGAPVEPRFRWHGADGAELALRLPNGRDQQAWIGAGPASPQALAEALIEPADAGATRPDHPALAAMLPALDDAFEEHDPLTALRLQTDCPACAHANSIACDLEALILAGFARTQAGMLDDVLKLALALHWSEADIMALPAWRLTHYLQRIQEMEAS